MYETQSEVDHLDELMARSRSGATPHLREIVSDEHTFRAQELLPLLEGMRVLTVATVTRRGEPRVSAVDGHFIHGRWTFGTDGRSAKAAHLAARPSVSLSWIDGERVGVFTHGTAAHLTPATPGADETIAHWKRHYGSDPRTWGDDVRLYVVDPTWMVAYRGEGAPEASEGL